MEVPSDWWQQDNPDQPKQAIGDYVESEGFQVPKRYDTLEEALAVVRGGGQIILRSEHADEYAGPSGLFNSYKINEKRISFGQRWHERLGGDIDIEEQFTDGRRLLPNTRMGPNRGGLGNIIIGQIFDNPPEVTLVRLAKAQALSKQVSNYAALQGETTEALIEGLSFSVWEYIPGTNVTVVGDDVVDSRYHVFTHTPEADGHNSFYAGMAAHENGEVIGSYVQGDESQTDPVHVRRLIQAYETVRNLGKFSAQHCPMVEMQIDPEGQIYFLQYHRARDLKAAPPPLQAGDFPTEDGWLRVEAVRGALPEPATLEMALAYPTGYGTSQGLFPELPTVEAASSNASSEYIALNEILVRRRKVEVMQTGFSLLYGDLPTTHGPRSAWFKPEVSLAIGHKGDDLLVSAELTNRIESAVQDGVMGRVAIDVAADGTKGFIRLNPEANQPIYDFGYGLK